MRVETTVTVPLSAVHDRAAHAGLITEARIRLASSGIASEDFLAAEPTIVVSDGDLGSHWANVTFSWGA